LYENIEKMKRKLLYMGFFGNTHTRPTLNDKTQSTLYIPTNREREKERMTFCFYQGSLDI